MARTRTPTVVVELSGRLGNHLFQYASGYAIARTAGAELRMTSRLVPPEDQLLQRLIGDTYVEASPLDLLRVGQFPLDVPPRPVWASATYHAARAVRRAGGKTPPSAIFWADTGRFRAQVFELDLPVFVQGHLQSEQYFAAYDEEIFRSIHLPPNDAALPPGRPTVAVSFRRGDYNALGWALPLAYYDKAAELAARRLGAVTFVLFGDDRAFLELAAPRLARHGAVVDGVALGEDPLLQLELMSRCDHCVIANSTFAWWGAWIGDHRHSGAERLVVAPAEFAGPDRVPARWTTLVSGATTL